MNEQVLYEKVYKQQEEEEEKWIRRKGTSRKEEKLFPFGRFDNNTKRKRGSVLLLQGWEIPSKFMEQEP
jgi:hypothetical protein